MNKAMETGLLAIVLIASSKLSQAQEDGIAETVTSTTGQVSESDCRTHFDSCEDGGLREIAKKVGIDTEAEDKLDASYALGVLFQQDVVAKYKEMDYRQFLLGALRQVQEKQTFPVTKLKEELDKHLLDMSEMSARFIMDFAQRKGAVKVDGIFRIDRNDWSGKEEIKCKEADDGKDYNVAFTRLGFDNDGLPEGVDTGQWKSDSFDVSEVIRGWRTALREMEEDDLWELAIASAQAYGNEGSSSVEKGEALRFLLMKCKKVG